MGFLLLSLARMVAAHWDKTQKVAVDHADWIEDGWKDWLRFDEASVPHLEGWMHDAPTKSRRRCSRLDRGKNLGFARVVATKALRDPFGRALTRGRSRRGFFSFTEVTDPAAHREYNEWHQLDHLPEQMPLGGIRSASAGWRRRDAEPYSVGSVRRLVWPPTT